jgi:hypothetical protein
MKESSMSSPKYSRTFHFPFSAGATNDDKIAATMEGLINVPIVITEKIDGSNASLEADGCYARTHTGAPTHKSFDMLKAFNSTVKHLIPDDHQLFGEWCYAKHSIEYSELPGYFLLFGVACYPKSRTNDKFHTDGRAWYGWNEVEKWAKDIGVPTVPVLFKGQVSSEKELQELVETFMTQPSICGGIREGVVARFAGAFKEGEFSHMVLKCVRANHVSPDNDHWKHNNIIKNGLCKR